MRSTKWLPLAASVATLALGASASATTFIGNKDVFNYFGGYATIASEQGPQKVSLDGFIWTDGPAGASEGALTKFLGTIQIGHEKFHIEIAPGSTATIHEGKSAFLTDATGMSFILHGGPNRASDAAQLSGTFSQDPLAHGKGVLYLTGSLVNGFPASGVALPNGRNGLKARDIAAQSVPEPTSWAMMLVGLGGLGGAMRTARSRRALAA